MKERPILFSGPMVRAILEGLKTQTRRVVKPQPPDWARNPSMATNGRGDLFCHWTDDGTIDCMCWPKDEPMRCPYGAPGDRLWVRETWGEHIQDIGDARQDRWFVYRADGKERPMDNGGEAPWRPSIHMPRWASRITLEITDVRVQRLQEISAADARAEGVESCTPYDEFRALWDSINGKTYPWASNPWVWALSFKVIGGEV